MNTTSDMASAAGPAAGVLAIKLALNPNNEETAPPVGSMRLRFLVELLLNLGEADAVELASLAGERVDGFNRSPENFYTVLERVIWELKLSKLFSRGHDRLFHRSIVPAAYNPDTGEHDPEQMAQWRAEFRGMAPEQQMMVATIIWLYQGGPDSTWLRRVTCTWRAAEALHYMRDAGCLNLWLALVAHYRPW